MKNKITINIEELLKLDDILPDKIKGELVKCPNCGYEFDSDETFHWLPDENGDPCVEYLSCPMCFIGTKSNWSCEMCPLGRAGKCKLDEECGATISCNFDDFKVVIK